jgi:hypothetical protein
MLQCIGRATALSGGVYSPLAKRQPRSDICRIAAIDRTALPIRPPKATSPVPRDPSERERERESALRDRDPRDRGGVLFPYRSPSFVEAG